MLAVYQFETRILLSNQKPKRPSRTTAFCRGLQAFVPRRIEKLCYDCDSRPVTLVFDKKTDRYEGKRICKVCIQSYKRRSGSFIAGV